jgi:hypothetical protein
LEVFLIINSSNNTTKNLEYIQHQQQHSMKARASSTSATTQHEGWSIINISNNTARRLEHHQHHQQHNMKAGASSTSTLG